MPVNKKTYIEQYTDPCNYSLYEIFFLHGTDCHICKLPIDFSAPRHVSAHGWQKGLQLDHVVPLARGGSDQIENVKPSHGICNVIKGDRISNEVKKTRYTPIRSVPKRKYY